MAQQQQQVRMETALDGYRDKAVDFFHENVMLRARIRDLEAENAELRAQQAPAADNGQGSRVKTLQGKAEQTPGAAGADG